MVVRFRQSFPFVGIEAPGITANTPANASIPNYLHSVDRCSPPLEIHHAERTSFPGSYIPAGPMATCSCHVYVYA